ncbi:MAG: glycoside hydrolase family 38 C-terminal domain-containing protein [Cyanobacteriota bacterium]|nr:glycoside hydrolase family 38 C-terminal domain-containing protein [Cyanobacteriota bacterium]
MIWPRGGQWRHLQLELHRPAAWRPLARAARARLCLRWWADQVELWADGQRIHRGDLFDTACRWPLPESWWQGRPLALDLRLRSPLHDDGALITSRIELEPLDPADPFDLLGPVRQELVQLGAGGAEARVQVLGHAHLDLAWLWPVADTWQAAERTFASALDLMERFPELHFAHSTPALYAWLERHRPALFARVQQAAAAGRFEPINGPWVETDCVLIATASLLRQFQHGQAESRRLFPGLEHPLAWLPDSFGFGAGLPALAEATGVRWFCTHKLAWNATNPFPHRLFRWRSRCGSELLALMSAPIGTDGDPLAMARYQQQWQQATGLPEALWLPGVGDHGGGPTAEMLEQLRLWADQPEAPAQVHGTLRDHLARLESSAGSWPVWRDELYLELHRGCATTRPDQKRHNRTLERLLREAELARVLAGAAAADAGPMDWEPLLFQQFHDILPGTSITAVFEQAEPQWRQARRRARSARDRALRQWLEGDPALPDGARGAQGRAAAESQHWWLAQLQPLPARPITLRLPAGHWWWGPVQLPRQPAASGGSWVQLPGVAGVAACRLDRRQLAGPPPPASDAAADLVVADPVRATPEHEGWLLANGQLQVRLGSLGVEQIWDRFGREQLAAPLALRRYRDAGEFWDAWDIAAGYSDHPLPWSWQGVPVLLEQGPLCVSFRWRGRCGSSGLRLDGRLLAGAPWLELTLAVDWCQRHELLRLEVPLAQRASRWAADTSGGVIERPAEPVNPREQARWEVAAVSWLASVTAGGGAPGGLAVLLDGPQGVSASAERLGVSLLRAPTWPDPGADNGWQRQRLALMPYQDSWSRAQVPAEALRLREPLWRRPVRRSLAGVERPGLPPLQPGLVLVGGRVTGAGAVLTVQNLTPRRRRLDPGPCWRLAERLDGLDQPLLPQPVAADLAALGPWELGCWRLEAV